MAMGVTVTTPGPAFWNNCRTSSLLGVAGGRVSVPSDGVESPTFTGIWYVSRIHWSDGSFDPSSPRVPSPRSVTFSSALLEALLRIWSVAPCGPRYVAPKLTDTLPDW